MNKPQRRLILAALAALAFGVHDWHFDYGTRVVPESDAATQLGQALLWWGYAPNPEVTARMRSMTQAELERTGTEAARKLLASNGSIGEDAQRIASEKGAEFARSYSANPRYGYDQWQFYVAANDRSTSADEALLWGVVGPIFVIGVGIFLILGWRKSATPSSS